MVSPANTATGLTHEGPGAESGEPDKYYPSGVRNYARVVTSDDIQGAIGAQYMQETLGCTSMYILDDKDAYGKGVADAFESAAGDINLEVAGHEGLGRTRRTQVPVHEDQASGADCLYIGGISCFNGGQLMKDKVSNVGRQREEVQTLVSDGFVLQSLFEEAGEENVEGAYGTAPTLNPDDLPGDGAAFIEEVLGAVRSA